MSKPRDDRQKDLLQPPLEEIIDLGHPLVRLAREIDWGFLDGRFSSVCRAGPGQPPLPSRLVAGLLILKHMHDLSDEALCARWLENPYYQFFCGEQSFQHRLPFERSSLTRWRQRLGEEQLTALVQESLSVAHKTGALETKDLERVAVDTTVQPKNIAFPTDARLLHKAIVVLGREAKKHAVPLRQSYVRVAKRAALMAGRYAHAKQFKRHNRELRFLRTRLGRLSRDIRRKTEHDAELRQAFALPLSRADQLRRQKQRQRGWKLYSWHAPEVECVGKGKARAPYEFGCKVSIATPITKPKGGQFVLHAKALHGNPGACPRAGEARPVGRSHPWPRDRRHGGAHRRRGPTHPRRQGLSRPQPSEQVSGLDLRPSATCHQDHPPRDEAPRDEAPRSSR